MLIISLENGDRQQAVTLRLEGRIAGPWTLELRTTCEKLLSENKSLRLDMAEVTFVDRGGLELLQDLQARGIALVECSPFTLEQLKALLSD